MTTFLHHSALSAVTRPATGSFACCRGANSPQTPLNSLHQQESSTLKEALSRYEAAQERFRADIRSDIAVRDEKAAERDRRAAERHQQILDKIDLMTFASIGAIVVGFSFLAFLFRSGI